jgi:hypothetical protein
MPFNSSYKDYDKLRYLNARDCFRNLAGIIVRDPLSTHLIKTVTREGKIRYLVVDRAQFPEEGDLAVICTPHGLRVGRLKRLVSSEDAWGKIIWFIQEA